MFVVYVTRVRKCKNVHIDFPDTDFCTQVRLSFSKDRPALAFTTRHGVTLFFRPLPNYGNNKVTLFETEKYFLSTMICFYIFSNKISAELHFE